jgi:hypothetical protein
MHKFAHIPEKAMKKNDQTMQFVSNQNLAHFKEYYFKNVNMIKIINIFG